MREPDWLEARAEYSRPWQEQAACRGEGGGLFFPPESEQKRSRTRRELRAKALCFRCPVLEMCRAHALRVVEPSGVWGGLNEDERADLLSRSDLLPVGAGAGSR